MFISIRTGRHKGFTLLELLITIMVAGLLLAGLSKVINSALNQHGVIKRRNELALQGQEAMQQMSDALRYSKKLFLPLADDIRTPRLENVRNNIDNSAVLAMLIRSDQDLDYNGPDADRDGDGKVDEDPGGDINNDYAPGIWLVDDDGDGLIDEGDGFFLNDDDDEDGVANEDEIDGIDNDGDGRIDEDPSNDHSRNFNADDDNQGGADEDWFDTKLFFLEGSQLKIRTPVPWPTMLGGIVNGRSVVIELLAENVTFLQFERLPIGQRVSKLVKITLTLESEQGDVVEFESTVRVGGSL